MIAPGSRRRLTARAVALSLGLACALAPGMALAQSAEDVASAKDAIKQARDLRNKGDFAAALPKFEAAYALVPTPLTGLELAKTEVQLGELVEAREVLLAVGQMPHADTESSIHKDARAEAQRLAEEIRPKIAALTIVVTGAPPDATPSLFVDGHEVPPAALSVPRRSNPGHHKVTAVLPNTPPQTFEVDVAPGESRDVKIDLGRAIPPPEPPPPPPPQPPPPAPALRVAPEPSSRVLPAATGSGGAVQTMFGIILTGLGAAAAGTGAFLNLEGKAAYERAAANCPGGRCASASDATAAANAATEGTLGFVLICAGGGAAALGLTLWVTAPSGHADRSGAVPVTRIALLPGGLRLEGNF